MQQNSCMSVFNLKEACSPKQYLMQANVSMCFHEDGPENLCHRCCNDLEFLLGCSGCSGRGRWRCVVCESRESCWVEPDPPILSQLCVWLPSFAQDCLKSTHGHQWPPSTVNICELSEFTNSHKTWCLPSGANIPVRLHAAGRRQKLLQMMWVKGNCLSAGNTAGSHLCGSAEWFHSEMKLSSARVIYTRCDSAVFWGMAACLPEKQTLCCHLCCFFLKIFIPWC